MIKSRLFLFILIASMALASCKKYTGELSFVEVEGVSLGIPDYMSEAGGLHPDALAQFSSKFRNVYFILLEEKHEGSFEAYTKKAIDELMKAPVYDETFLADSFALTVDGMPAVHAEVLGHEGPHMVYTKVRTIDAGDAFYRMIIWTRAPYRRLAFGKDMDAILSSFTLLQ